METGTPIKLMSECSSCNKAHSQWKLKWQNCYCMSVSFPVVVTDMWYLPSYTHLLFFSPQAVYGSTAECVFKLWFSLTITIIVMQCPLSVHTLQPCGWIDGTFFIQTKNTWHVQWLSIAAQHVYTVKANLSDNNRNSRCSDSVIDQFIVDLMVFDVISVSTSQQGTAGYVKARGDIWRGRRGPGVLRQTHSSDWGQLMCPCAIFVSAAVIVIFYT